MMVNSPLKHLLTTASVGINFEHHVAHTNTQNDLVESLIKRVQLTSRSLLYMPGNFCLVTFVRGLLPRDLRLYMLQAWFLFDQQLIMNNPFHNFYCDGPIPGVPLITCQPAKTCEYRVSRYHTHLSHIWRPHFCIIFLQITKF